MNMNWLSKIGSKIVDSVGVKASSKAMNPALEKTVESGMQKGLWDKIKGGSKVAFGFGSAAMPFISGATKTAAKGGALVMGGMALTKIVNAITNFIGNLNGNDLVNKMNDKSKELSNKDISTNDSGVSELTDSLQKGMDNASDPKAFEKTLSNSSEASPDVSQKDSGVELDV